MARAKALREPWPRTRSGPLALLRDHGRILRDSVRFVTERLGTSLLVWLLVGIALALPAGLYLLQVNLTALTSAWEGRPGLSVYFELGAPQPVISALAARLDEHPAVSEVSVISAEQALAEFRAHADLGDALALLEENPLPASLRAVLVPGAAPHALDELAAEAGAGEAVDEVVMERTWLERVSRITQVVTRLGVMLAVLFGVGAVLITATSVRLAIEARLEEVRVMKLVGATQTQMRRPFLYFGAIYGLGGGLVAAMLISLGLLVIEDPLSALVGSYGREPDLAGFDLGFIGVLFAIAGVLGVTGALAAVRQRLSTLEIL